VIATCTPFTVVSRSTLMSVIITFMFEPAKLQINWARASGTSTLRSALDGCPAVLRSATCTPLPVRSQPHHSGADLTTTPTGPPEPHSPHALPAMRRRRRTAPAGHRALEIDAAHAPQGAVHHAPPPRRVTGETLRPCSTPRHHLVGVKPTVHRIRWRGTCIHCSGEMWNGGAAALIVPPTIYFPAWSGAHIPTAFLETADEQQAVDVTRQHSDGGPGFESPHPAAASPPGSAHEAVGHQGRASPSGRSGSHRRQVEHRSCRPCHPRAISSGHQRYPPVNHGHQVRVDERDVRS
jgi:hypothetical protein